MSGSITVLVVDEDRDILDLTATFLEREADRIDVETADSMTTALERIETGSEPVDCVVSDYTMPEMTGAEFLSAVRERDSALPFFFFTGRDRSQITAELEDEPIDGYVKKGTGTDRYAELAAAIVEAVDE